MSVIEMSALVGAETVTCDTPAALTDFNGVKYMGTWYEQDHVKNQGFQPDSFGCV